MRHAARAAVLVASLPTFVGWVGAPAVDAQDKPRYGGERIFVVPSKPPTYDGPAEGTFGVVHPLARHYNTLLRIDPNDLSRDGVTYTHWGRHKMPCSTTST